MEDMTQARLDKMQSLADAILDKLRIRVEQTKPEEINPQSLKHMTGVMKDLKDILRSQADMEEQDTKIKNLKRQLEQDGTTAITVTFAPELEDYSE